MNLDDIKNIVTEKVAELSKDEATTDTVLDKVQEVAEKATGGKLGEHLDTARDFLDSKLGGE
ncbi:Rv0909 family putative TA system antitoxin [Gleimia coleocanis]|nr:Rv0909 family putative TA system antitoxin [Gleimia coleocanis]